MDQVHYTRRCCATILEGRGRLIVHAGHHAVACVVRVERIQVLFYGAGAHEFLLTTLLMPDMTSSFFASVAFGGFLAWRWRIGGGDGHDSISWLSGTDGSISQRMGSGMDMSRAALGSGDVIFTVVRVAR